MRPRAPGRDPEGSFPPEPAEGSGVVLLQETSRHRSRWLWFAQPEAILIARQPAEVAPLLDEVERAVHQGRIAAGYLAYEAAGGLDPALITRPPATDLPLAWFAVYPGSREVDAPAPPGIVSPGAPSGSPRDPAGSAGTAPVFRPTLPAGAFRAGVEEIRGWIAAAHTYQVNFTQRLRAPFRGDAAELFRALHHAQGGACSAYIDTGRFAVCSASPELFFRREGEAIEMRPMKGTRRRGRTLDEDMARAVALLASEKERAENLMIVDMVRNDLGRIATTGSVRVDRLFEVERYETVWQMTSTVSARTQAPLVETMRALFPCASVTGAPKVRTMELIAGLEREPRGVYCGAIGFVAPDRAQFSVAIRTAGVDRLRGEAEFGTGGGIVWDSDPAMEEEECRAKAAILTTRRPAFRLLETMRLGRSGQVWLLDRHLRRLAASARYFGFRCDEEEIRAQLAALPASLPAPPAPRDATARLPIDGGVHTPWRVRLLLDRDGEIELDTTPLAPVPHRPWRVALAEDPIDPDDVFFYHKTTHRAAYETARRAGADDTLLWNPQGELTESTIANLAVRLDGIWCTPPVRSGLLAGTARDALLEAGIVRERVVRREDLVRAEGLALLNSVRGWIAARLVV